MAGKDENGSFTSATQPHIRHSIGRDRFGYEAGRSQALGNQRLASVIDRRDRSARDQLLGEFEGGSHRRPPIVTAALRPPTKCSA